MFDNRAITVKFKTDIKDYLSGIKQASQNLKGFVAESKTALAQLSHETAGVRKAIGNVANGFKDAAGAVINFGKVAVTGIAAAGVALTAYGTKMASSIEQTAVAFDTMLGNADERRKLMSDITNFAKNTPFERFQLIDASKQLLAMGINADKIIPSMQMLGDVSAGVSTNVQEVAFVFGQVRAQGQAYTQDLNQFATRGIPIYEELAKTLGITVDVLRRGMTDGTIKVGFDQIETAFKSMTSEGGKFYGMMNKQSLTFSGVMSNVKDTFDNIVLSFMGITSEGDIRQGSFFDIVTQKATAFQAWLSSNEETISNWGSRVFTSIGNGITWAWDNMISPVLIDLQYWFNTGGKESIKTFVNEGWQVVQNAFRVFVTDIWPHIRGALSQLMGYMSSSQFRADMASFANVFTTVSSVIGQTASAIVSLISEIRNLISEYKQFEDQVYNKAGVDKRPVAGSLRAGLTRTLFGRANGGPVKGNQMYEVGEFNRPELLMVKGKQYLIPGNDGRVMNQAQVASQTTNNNSKTINITQYGSNLDSTFISAPLLSI